MPVFALIFIIYAIWKMSQLKNDKKGLSAVSGILKLATLCCSVQYLGEKINEILYYTHTPEVVSESVGGRNGPPTLSKKIRDQYAWVGKSIKSQIH